MFGGLHIYRYILLALELPKCRQLSNSPQKASLQANR